MENFLKNYVKFKLLRDGCTNNYSAHQINQHYRKERADREKEREEAKALAEKRVASFVLFQFS